MKSLSKTLIAATAFAAIATTAFSQVPWEFNPGMAYMYSGPGKMSAMAMAATTAAGARGERSRGCRGLAFTAGISAENAERHLRAKNLENRQGRKDGRIAGIDPIARKHLVGVDENRRIAGDARYGTQQVVGRHTEHVVS